MNLSATNVIRARQGIEHTKEDDRGKQPGGYGYMILTQQIFSTKVLKYTLINELYNIHGHPVCFPLKG